jgi:tetratricopeptide (TPR) repeat protein
MPGQSRGTIIGLWVALGVLLVLSVVFPVAGHKVEQGERAAKREAHKQQLAAEREQARREQIDGLLAVGSAERLPRLSELTDANFGATPTRYSIRGNAPYVPRGAADQRIRDLLATPGPPYPFVIVWGTTKAGKSRTLAEALRATFVNDPAVVLPHGEQGLIQLARLGVGDLVDHRPAVVVLDDLSPAQLETLTGGVLDLIADWAVIAATMTAQRRNEVLKTGSEVSAVARTALELRSRQYELTSGPPVGTEMINAKQLYPGERFVGSIAETLVGAQELIARYKASQDNDPAGCAVVRAAIDARRAGLARPVSEPVLRRLFPLYLSAIRIDLDPTNQRFTEGIQFATQPVSSQVALLRPTNQTQEPPEWIVFDHAVTADEGDGNNPPRPVPSETWTELIDVLRPQDTFAVAMAASAKNQTAAAISAFGKAAAPNDDIVAPVAALNLGLLLGQEPDVEGAKAAYQQAINSGHPEAAPGAALGLGLLLGQNGDLKGAEDAYRQATSYADSVTAPTAALSLGNLLTQKPDGPDVEGAKAAYQQAINSGRPDIVPMAALMLGNLLDDQGDVEGARIAYQRVIDSGHPDYGPETALTLGNMLMKKGDVDGAKAAYQQAINSGRPDVAPRAALTLGNLLMRKGDVDGAEDAYRQAIESGHPEAAPGAALSLGVLLGQKGEVEDAEDAYRLATSYAGSYAAPIATLNLGNLLMEKGDVEGAEDAYRQAVDSGRSHIVWQAALSLGNLLMKKGDVEGARIAYQQVIESGEANEAATAAAQRVLDELG